jgi:prophage regulatory protein
MQQTPSVLRLPQVKTLTGLSRSSIYAAVKAGSFPAPFRLGPRAVGFSGAAVEAWLAARMAGKPDAEVRALVKDLNQREAV